MKHLEQKLDIGAKVQTSFNDSNRHILSRLFQINDRVSPAYADVKVFDKLANLLQSLPDGSRTLATPEPVNLWHMVAMIESIEGAIRPDLRELGPLFLHTGMYIAKRLDSVVEGKSIAENMALALYQYGDALISGTWNPLATLADAARPDLTREATDAVELFMAGSELFEMGHKKMNHLTENQIVFRRDTEEAYRRNTLRQFFRILDHALTLKDTDETKLKFPERDPILVPHHATEENAHTVFLEKAIENIYQTIDTPKTELFRLIFERGRNNLLHEMYNLGEQKTAKIIPNLFGLESITLNFRKKPLLESIPFDRYIYSLAQVRETGSPEDIAATERTVADALHKIVAAYPFATEQNNPTEMIVDQKMNCLGSSMLLGVLFEEAGIPYVDVILPDHVTLLVPLSDGTLIWYDGTHPEISIPLTEKMVLEEVRHTITKGPRKGTVVKKKISALPAIQDFISGKTEKSPVVQMSVHSHNPTGILLGHAHGQYAEIMQSTEGQLLCQLLNVAKTYGDKNEIKEERALVELTATLFPRVAEVFMELGNLASNDKKYEEAIDYYKHGIALNPDAPNIGRHYMFMADAYANLGNTHIGAIDKAKSVIQEALELDGLNGNAYFINGLIEKAREDHLESVENLLVAIMLGMDE